MAVGISSPAAPAATAPRLLAGPEVAPQTPGGAAPSTTSTTTPVTEPRGMTVSLIRRSAEEKAAVAAMKAADKALNENSDRERRAGIRHETPEYRRLNAVANEAAAKVSFWHGGTKRGR